jgi:hypothetical protein
MRIETIDGSGALCRTTRCVSAIIKDAVEVASRTNPYRAIRAQCMSSIKLGVYIFKSSASFHPIRKSAWVV